MQPDARIRRHVAIAWGIVALAAVLAVGWIAVPWLRNGTPETSIGLTSGWSSQGQATTLGRPHVPDRVLASRPPGESVRIEVVTLEGAPVPGARVLCLRSQTWSLIGQCDSLGTLQFEMDDVTASLACRVEAQDFEPTAVEIRAAVKREYTVQLLGRSCIRGVVVGPDALLSAPVSVVAFPENVRPTARALAEDRDTQSTIADAPGRFSLCGVEPGSRWWVAAGTQGFATSSPVLVRASTGSSVELRLRAYAALALELQSPGAGPACISSELHSLELGFECVQRGGNFFDATSAQALLAGVPLDWCTPRGDRYLLLCEPPGSEPASAMLQCRPKLPGYRRVDISLEAKPLENGFRPETLRLIEATAGWGTLGVRIDWGTHRQRTLSTGLDAPLQLVLAPFTGDTPLRFKLAAVMAGETAIDCIPRGGYRAWLEFLPGHLLATPDDGMDGVTISPDQLSSLAFDLGTVGSVDVQLVREDGSQFGGPALFRVEIRSTGTAFRSRFVAFAQAPYRLPALAPGEYRMWPSSPALRDRIPAECPWLTITGEQEASISYAISE